MSRYKPPKASRSGNLFKRPTHRVGLSITLFISILVILIATVETPLTNRIRQEVDNFLSPVFSVLSKPLDWGRSSMEWVDTIFSIRKDNERLREENQRLQEWRQVAERLDLENRRLRRILNAVPLEVETLLTARVVAVAGGPYVQSVLINAGSSLGLEENLTVSDETAIVGRLVLVARNSARVLLLTDLNSRIPVRLERSGENGIVVGTNADTLDLRFLPIDPDVEIGDRVLTSGDGGIFPPDLPVAFVSNIEGDNVSLTPIADLSSLTFLRVLDYRPWLMEPRTAVESESSSDREN